VRVAAQVEHADAHLQPEVVLVHAEVAQVETPPALAGDPGDGAFDLGPGVDYAAEEFERRTAEGEPVTPTPLKKAE
jgi:hypothetical protein